MPDLQEMHGELNNIPDAFVAKKDEFIGCIIAGISNEEIVDLYKEDAGITNVDDWKNRLMIYLSHDMS